jgi:hypothetical protein
MREQLKADFTYAEVKRTDPRMPDNRGKYTGASFGTDWAGYCANWLTEYERTLDTKWLDKIKAGMDSQLAFAAKPGQLLGSGPYDPETGRFMGRNERRFAAEEMPGAPKDAPKSEPKDAGKRGGRRGEPGEEFGGPSGFDLAFGTPEIMAEMELVVDHPAYWAAWHNYGAHTPGQPMAYAAYVMKDANLGQQVAQTLVAASRHRVIQPGQFGVNFDVKAHLVSAPDVPSPVWELTGMPEGGPDGHRMRTIIESLDWAGQYLPKD